MTLQSHSSKAQIFRTLHETSGCFLMPNAWDAGSARILSAEGFSALGTTSAGIAISKRRPDGAQRVSRSEMMETIHQIAQAVSVPVSADLESGFGDRTQEVAHTVELAIQAGAVGGNIEDACAKNETGLYELPQALDRIRAARSVSPAFTLTARTDACLVAGPLPLADAIERCQAFVDAGAHCVFVPGLTTATDIRRLVQEVPAAVSIVMGLKASALTKSELTTLGVRRISVGGSLARASLGLLRRASRNMLDAGDFAHASGQIPDAELNELFSMDDSTARTMRRH
jgi:2-methylisocitrate lyase-like PEP mutase family enzyme